MGNKSTKQKDSNGVINENDVNKGTGEDKDESVVQKMKSKLEKVMESLETKPQESVVENGSDSSPLIGNGIQTDKKPEDTNGTEDAIVNGSEVVGNSEEKLVEELVEATEAATNNSEDGDAKKEETTEPDDLNKVVEEAVLDKVVEEAVLDNVVEEAVLDKVVEEAVLDKVVEEAVLDKVVEEAVLDTISLKEQTDGEQKEKDDSAVAKEE